MCLGSTTHIINGKEVLLSEGELLFLSRNARHSIRTAAEGRKPPDRASCVAGGG